MDLILDNRLTFQLLKVLSPSIIFLRHCLIKGCHKRLRIVHTIEFSNGGADIQILRLAIYEEQWVSLANIEEHSIRVFWYRTGKLRTVYDESLEVAQDLQRSDVPMYHLEAIEYGRQVAVEKRIEQTEQTENVLNQMQSLTKVLTFLSMLHSLRLRW